MKKTFLALTVAASAALLTACGSMGALGTLAGSATGTSTSSSSSSGSAAINALSNVLGDLLGASTLKADDLYGTWNYSGSDCVFESENLLMKAGGAVAATEVEGKLDEQFAKIGIRKGSASFTFNKDNSFKAVLGGKTVSGTYSFNEKQKKITFKTLLGLSSMTANIARSGSKVSLLFDADKALKFATLLGSMSGNTTVTAISEIASKYDGMQIGMQLQK